MTSLGLLAFAPVEVHWKSERMKEISRVAAYFVALQVGPGLARFLGDEFGVGPCLAVDFACCRYVDLPAFGSELVFAAALPSQEDLVMEAFVDSASPKESRLGP